MRSLVVVGCQGCHGIFFTSGRPLGGWWVAQRLSRSPNPHTPYASRASRPRNLEPTTDMRTGAQAYGGIFDSVPVAGPPCLITPWLAWDTTDTRCMEYHVSVPHHAYSVKLYRICRSSWSYRRFVMRSPHVQISLPVPFRLVRNLESLGPLWL